MPIFAQQQLTKEHKYKTAISVIYWPPYTQTPLTPPPPLPHPHPNPTPNPSKKQAILVVAK